MLFQPFSLEFAYGDGYGFMVLINTIYDAFVLGNELL